MDEKKVREAIEYLKASIEADEEVQKGIKDEEIIKISKTLISYEKTAIEALEKQLPMKLIEHHYEEQGEALYVKYGCGNGCKIQPSRSSKYCNQCGQRLDWSE